MGAEFAGLQPPGGAGSASVPREGGDNREEIGRALEACRQYLLLVAGRELDADLRAKGGASDLVQETFLEAHEDLSRFSGRSEHELRAWLRRILLNNLANFRRRYRATGKRQVGREVSIDDSRAVGDTKAKLVAVDDSPSRQARRNEKTRAVAAGLERLPEHYRRVIVWRHFDRHSFEEIGRRLGSSADAARMIWARGMKRLHQEIDGSWASDSWGTRP